MSKRRGTLEGWEPPEIRLLDRILGSRGSPVGSRRARRSRKVRASFTRTCMGVVKRGNRGWFALRKLASDAPSDEGVRRVIRL